jgi:hypothetical protein
MHDDRLMSTHHNNDDSSAIEVEDDRKASQGNERRAWDVIYDIEDETNGQASTGEYDYKSQTIMV